MCFKVERVIKYFYFILSDENWEMTFGPDNCDKSSFKVVVEQKLDLNMFKKVWRREIKGSEYRFLFQGVLL